MNIPPDDTLSERLQWYVTELAQLRRVLALGEALEAEEPGLGVPPNWHALKAVQTYARLIDAAAASDARMAAAVPLAELARTVDEMAQWTDAAPCVMQLAQAVEDRDHESYAAGWSGSLRSSRWWQAGRDRLCPVRSTARRVHGCVDLQAEVTRTERGVRNRTASTLMAPDCGDAMLAQARMPTTGSSRSR